MTTIRWIWGIILIYCIVGISTTNIDTDVIVLTVASNETDGFKRYIRSARVFGFEDKVHVVGMDEPWRGGNMNFPGGGYKINLLKEQLEQFKDDDQKIVLFTDSYDVIFLAELEEIVERFKLFNARVLFAAEKFCWPLESLAADYPTVTQGEPYLNSGGFIGYAADVYAILTVSPVGDDDDDQLFYTRVYLNAEVRQKHNIQLDHQSQIFQNLNGATENVQLEFKGNDAYLQNTAYNTQPRILHGNGPSKLVLNYLGNYLAKSWGPEEGCRSCWDNTVILDGNNYPQILVAIFIDQATPFLEEFLEKINLQAYPKNKLDVFIYNNVLFHEHHVNNWIETHSKEYSSLKTIIPSDNIDEVSARELAMDLCLRKGCSGFFFIDSLSHLDNKHTLKLLVEQQRNIVAPLLVRPSQAWSNFWGAIGTNGYYARSLDYMKIIENERRGLWNVPYISNCYLINATIIQNIKTRPVYKDTDDLDPEMAFALTNRQRGVFMFVNNRVDFGHLINADDFDIKLTNPDLYELMNNKIDWEQRYLHENYSKNFDTPAIQPCPDVYWFPIVNERFTKAFIEIMEAFGKWSDGSNQDTRLQGGYENVPTRDIHMNQVNYERQWLHILKEYVRPLQELVFEGYFHDDPRISGGYEAVPTRDIHMTQVDLEEMWLEFLRIYVSPLQERVFLGYKDYPPRSIMNFVVRYRPDEQPSLRPHHDSSTYTINVALNRVGEDYEGGGCRFLRYNCAVTDTKPGWMLMHPGRLTHYHEGLKVTKGTRYIMISFVDP